MAWEVARGEEVVDLGEGLALVSGVGAGRLGKGLGGVCVEVFDQVAYPVL